MSWYDWVPGAANVAGIAKGDPWQAVFGGPAYELVKDAKKKLYDDPANEQKAGYDQAMAMGNQGTNNLVNFYATQKANALANYKPLQQMFSQSYGTGGLMAPQLPGNKIPPYGGK